MLTAADSHGGMKSSKFVFNSLIWSVRVTHKSLDDKLAKILNNEGRGEHFLRIKLCISARILGSKTNWNLILKLYILSTLLCFSRWVVMCMFVSCIGSCMYTHGCKWRCNLPQRRQTGLQSTTLSMLMLDPFASKCLLYISCRTQACVFGPRVVGTRSSIIVNVTQSQRRSRQECVALHIGCISSDGNNWVLPLKCDRQGVKGL